MAARKQQSGGAKRSNGSRSRSEGRGAVSRASSNKLSSDQLEGREPSHEPDVFVDIRKVKVDEIYVDVEQLEAHLALRAKLANLLQVVAGVHISLGKVEVDISGVEAEALLKVRLENLYDILDRALTTLDRNPEILESLVKTVDDTVGDVGDLGEKALGPGGAVSQLGGSLGQVVGDVGQGLGQVAGDLRQGLPDAGGGPEQMAGQGASTAGAADGGDGNGAGSKGRARQTKRGSKRGSIRPPGGNSGNSSGPNATRNKAAGTSRKRGSSRSS
jgi:hypothetical protein